MAIFRDLPNPTLDGAAPTAVPSRTGRYGEAYVSNLGNNALFFGDEGTYFTARTPTPGTGIIGHAAPTTFDETKPYLLLYNAGQKRVYPQFLRLHETVVSTAAVRVQLTVCLDTGNRYSSAGTALTVQNVNQDTTASSGVTGFCGAVVASAATASRRIIDHIVFRGTIDVVEDVYEIVFGAVNTGSGAPSRAATVADFSRGTAPVVIGPGQSLLVHQWSASQSAGPTWQVTLGYVER